MDVSNEDGYGDAVFGGAMVGINLLVAFLGAGQILVDAYQEQWDAIKAEHRGATFGFVLAETVRRTLFGRKKAGTNKRAVAVAPSDGRHEEGNWTAATVGNPPAASRQIEAV